MYTKSEVLSEVYLKLTGSVCSDSLDSSAETRSSVSLLPSKESLVEQRQIETTEASETD